MTNNNKNEYTDELSEMLGRNKERHSSSNENSFGSGSEFDNAEENVNDAVPAASDKNNEGGVSSHTAQFEEIHDIDFDDEPAIEKKSRRVREVERQLRNQSRARKTVIRIILGIAISGFVIFFGVRIGGSIYDAFIDYTGINNNEFQVMVEIPENPSVNQVADILKTNGIITDKDFFIKYVESQEDFDRFVGGEFNLSSAMSYGRIMDALLISKTKRVTVEVTVIEGMTAYQVGELLEENHVCRAEDFMKFYRKRMNVYDFELRLKDNPYKFNQMEGYLFPDKYEFYVNNELRDYPDKEIDTTKDAEVAARKIYSNFNSKITKTMYKQMGEMGLTLDEVITLASMVQSEVNNLEDMRMVASVFLNRLEAGGDVSKLQSDPTVFYVQDYIEPYYKGSGITTSLAAISNAYDTYECDGIPAGAICNPGLDAIGAVLDAYDTDYYYFCANEETGETFYGKTLEEHQENLKKAGIE